MNATRDTPDNLKSLIGQSVSFVDTPALVVDLDAMERNLVTMAAFAKLHNVKLRPHAKMHKSAAVAKLQMAQSMDPDDASVTSATMMAKQLMRLQIDKRNGHLALRVGDTFGQRGARVKDHPSNKLRSGRGRVPIPGVVEERQVGPRDQRSLHRDVRLSDRHDAVALVACDLRVGDGSRRAHQAG